MTAIDALFQRFGLDPRDLAGTWLATEVPVAESFINRLIATRLQRHAHIASVQVTLREGDEALVRIEPRARLMPVVPVVVRIERQPEFPHDPTLRLRWSMPSVGPLALIARSVAGYITALPEGIRIDGDGILIDLRALLRSRGAEEVITLVRRVAFHTRPGALVVQVEAGLG